MTAVPLTARARRSGRTADSESVLHWSRVARGLAMANLTIAVDDRLLHQARVRAAELGTSVNAVLRDYMRVWAGSNQARTDAVASLLRRSGRSRSGRGDRGWTRDDLHER